MLGFMWLLLLLVIYNVTTVIGNLTAQMRVDQGLTSAKLSPEDAVKKVLYVGGEIQQLSVVGIAGHWGCFGKS